MVAKYYIYAGGRWCEVDTRRGRVEGWRQRARFCFLKGGRLEVARSTPVLRALRSLAAGAGGAARDAAPLLHSRRRRPRRESVAPAHVCCAHHLHHSRCDLNANELADKPPPLQVVAPVSSPLKRKRSSEDLPNNAKQARNAPSPQKKNASEKENIRVSTKKESPIKSRSKQEKLARNLLQSSSDEISQKTQQKSLHQSPKKLARPVRTGSVEKVVQLLLQSSSTEDTEKERVFKSPQKARKPKFRSDKSESSSVSVRTDGPCKELIIDESDVAMLRCFLAKTVDTEDLDRFDNDDGYKTRLFYRLNPLVTLQRNKQMEQLLLQRLTLKEFAKQLGLRSVADVTPEKRYRMRHSTRRARHVTSDSDTGKDVAPKRRQLWNRDNAVFNSFRSSRSSDVRDKPQIPKPARESSPVTSDSDTEVKQHIKRNLERRASARRNPRHKEKQTGPIKNDESVLVSDESDTDESKAKSKKTRSRNKKDGSVVVSDDSNENRRKSRSRAASRAAKEADSVVVSGSDSDENKQKSARRTRAGNKAAKKDESVVVSDDSESDSSSDEKRQKSTRITRETSKADKHNESVVVSDESDSDSNSGENRQKTTRRNRASIRAEKDNESVVVSDKSDSNTDEIREKAAKKTRTSNRTKDNESVVVSDKSDSKDEIREKTSRKTRTANIAKDSESVAVSNKSDSNRDKIREKSASKTRVNRAQDNESVVVSDESGKSNERRRSTRRTRSHGPDKKLPREPNSSVVISDDSDSAGNENRAAQAAGTLKSKYVAVSDGSNSNNDENKGKRRLTRSTGPERALKEQNNDSISKKETDSKTKKDVDNTNKLRTTRSSMKGVDDTSIKEKTKTDTPKKDLPTSSKTEVAKSKEDKPNKEVTKSTKKADASKSDSENAFDTSKSSPKKQRPPFGNLIRNVKGRFVRKEVRKSKENQSRSDKSDKGNKASDRTKENSNESRTSGRKMVNGKVLKRKPENKINLTHKRENQTDETGGKHERRKDKDDGNKSEKHMKETENSSKNKKKSAVDGMFIKPVKFKKSSVANGREYTSLEDHAIVAWVSVGGRERLVNGNAIWRELQHEYPRLTSQIRSWHSLRNRYLRYILPALASLALPPAQVSRLRAAAATGKIKSLPGYRRNSIFNVPNVRSATARRPLAARSDNKRERTPPSPRRARLASPSKLPAHRAPAPAPSPKLKISTPTPQKKRRIHHL